MWKLVWSAASEIIVILAVVFAWWLMVMMMFALNDPKSKRPKKGK